MIGRVVADRVRAAVGADGLSLGMISEDRQSLGWIAIAGYPDQLRERFVSLPLSRRTATTDAAVAGRPVILPSREDYSREYPDTFRRATAGSAASWLAWPLRAGQASFGSLTLMWRRPQRFGAGQLAFIAAVADLVAQALVRAKVYADEHAIAAILQKAVTPDLVAGIPGLDIGACYRQAGASMAIGGDWYDALALPGGGGYIAVGDVVGHGLAAVEDMTQLRNAARALAVAGHQPSSLLHELARFNSVATSGKFATMAVAIFAPDGTHATCGMAGHPPMLIRRAGTGTVERLSGVSDPPLVPFDDVTYAQFAISLEPGDVMLLYTDGLMERRGENPEEGIKRITKELRAWQPAVPLEAFCQELVTVLAVDPQPDDICVLAVRRPEVSSWPGG
jgi:serine phosphatase RsbU (regulator of sigma subunit)